MNWLRRLFGKPVRHYPSFWDGTHETCACGYHSVKDYDLREHFAEQKRIGP
jgi:hypothetical protein